MKSGKVLKVDPATEIFKKQTKNNNNKRNKKVDPATVHNNCGLAYTEPLKKIITIKRWI